MAALGLKGDDTGRALNSALDKALSAASTERSVQAVIDQMQELGKQGLVSGEQIAAGLAKAKQKKKTKANANAPSQSASGGTDGSGTPAPGLVNKGGTAGYGTSTWSSTGSPHP